MEKKHIKNLLEKCWKEIYEKENCLFENNAQEESVSHKFACCLQREIDNLNPKGELEELVVDIEYNRSGKKNPKKANKKPIRPDIVIHKRDSQENNLIVIEIKKRSHKDEDKERAKDKLRKFKKGIGLNIEKYEYAFYIEYDKNLENLIIEEIDDLSNLNLK